MAANLSHLKIGRVPEAFSEWAQKHNQLVSLIESIEAAYGLDIKIIANPPKMLHVPKTPGANSKQTQGRIRIGLKPGIIPGAGGGGGSSSGTTQAVSIDGTLVNVMAATGVNTNTTNYPTRLKTNGNGVQSQMDDFGFYTTNSNYDATMSPGVLDIFRGSKRLTFNAAGLSVLSGSNAVTQDASGFYISGPTYGLGIQFSLISRAMGITTINVCSNGATKSMDIIASAPY